MTMGTEIVEAVRQGYAAEVMKLVKDGGDVNARDSDTGLTVLMIAAGRGDAEVAGVLVDAGADVLTCDRRGGASVLHKACQGGNVEVVHLLVEAGAFVDSVAPTTGHTPLMDAVWFKFPDIAAYLLSVGASWNLSTHYGSSLEQHFQYEVGVNVQGRDRFVKAERALRERQKRDEELIESQELMKAVVAKDAGLVRQVLGSGADVDERAPIVNGFNDGHTPLLVASRDGTAEIVRELVAAGADVNAVDPVFGAVPLHKAVYNGHADITEILLKPPAVDKDFQGATNGYSPLHDALWHGFEDCARLLIEAGGRLDLRGHDDKTPLDIAIDVLGSDHSLVQLIHERVESG